MITFAADKATARIAGEFYINAINVMRRRQRFQLPRPARAGSLRHRVLAARRSQAAAHAQAEAAGRSRGADHRRRRRHRPCHSAPTHGRRRLRGDLRHRSRRAGQRRDRPQEEIRQRRGRQFLGGRDARRRRGRGLPRQRLEIRRRGHLHLERRHRLGQPLRRDHSRAWQKNMDILAPAIS